MSTPTSEPSFETLQAARACDDATLQRAIIDAQAQRIRDAARAAAGAFTLAVPYTISSLSITRALPTREALAAACASAREQVQGLLAALDTLEATYDDADRVCRLLPPGEGAGDAGGDAGGEGAS